MIRREFPGGRSPGMGGIESGGDAAQFILLGSDTVQVCTGVMKFGYECVKPMCEELLAFMEKHEFETLADFKGKSLDYFTTHAELVRMQADKKAAQKAAVAAEQQKKMVLADGEWSGDSVRAAIRRAGAGVNALRRRLSNRVGMPLRGSPKFSCLTSLLERPSPKSGDCLGSIPT